MDKKAYFLIDKEYFGAKIKIKTNTNKYFKSISSKILEELNKNYTQLNRYNTSDYGIFYEVYLDSTQLRLFVENLQKYNIDCFICKDKNDFKKNCKIIDDETITSNIEEITKASEKYLKGKHNFRHFQTEFTHSSLSVRTDQFGITENREIVSVEIKSDKDTFVRLKKQLEEYSKFSHIVYLVLDIKHLSKFLKSFPNYYENILVYENGEIDEYRINQKMKYVETYNLLWKQELVQFCHYFKGSFSSMTISKLDNIIRKVFTVDEFYKISEFLFVNRYLSPDKMQDFKHLIIDLDYKIDLANKIKKS